MDYCDDCPHRLVGTPCPALTRPHPRYCWLVSGANPDPASRAAYRWIVAGAEPVTAPPPRPLRTPAVAGHPGPCCGGAPEFFESPPARRQPPGVAEYFVVPEGESQGVRS